MRFVGLYLKVRFDFPIVAFVFCASDLNLVAKEGEAEVKGTRPKNIRGARLDLDCEFVPKRGSYCESHDTSPQNPNP